MLRLISLVLLAVSLASPLSATGAETDETPTPALTWAGAPETIFDASEINLDDFLWLARPVVVFADSPLDPAFEQQMAFLLDRQAALVERDVVLITDTDPAAGGELRRKLRPRGFMLALIGKDGGVKLRKPLPWDVRELSRVIDKMPMRQQEIRDALGGK